jgi:hypothetical protein
MIFLLPAALTVLALVVLGVGLQLSGRFLRRQRYIYGLIAIAVGLVSVWLLQFIVSAMDVQLDTRWVLQIGGFILSFFILASGLGAVGKANNTPRDDFIDDLFS